MMMFVVVQTVFWMRSAAKCSATQFQDLRIVDIAVAVVIDRNMWDHVGVTTLID